MDDHGLAQALRDAVPDPPREIDPDAVLDGAHVVGGRSRPLLAIVATVVVVAAVAIGTWVFSAHRTSNPTASPRDTLIRTTWQLDRVDVGPTRSSISDDDAWTLRFAASGGSVKDRYGESVSTHITATAIDFGAGDLSGIRRGNALGPGPQPIDAVTAILHGHTTWHITSNSLTITHRGVGSAHFHRFVTCAYGADSGRLSAKERRLAVRVAKTAARGSYPSSSGGPTTAPTSSGWPVNVDEVTARCTLHSRAGGGRNDQRAVLEIRMLGRFSSYTTGPTNAQNHIDGNVVTVTAFLSNGDEPDGGIANEPHPTGLPNSTVIYRR